MVDLTQICLGLISLLGLAVTGFVVPWLKARLGEKKLETLNYWVTVAAEAA